MPSWPLTPPLSPVTWPTAPRLIAVRPGCPPTRFGQGKVRSRFRDWTWQAAARTGCAGNKKKFYGCAAQSGHNWLGRPDKAAEGPIRPRLTKVVSHTAKNVKKNSVAVRPDPAAAYQGGQTRPPPAQLDVPAQQRKKKFCACAAQSSHCWPGQIRPHNKKKMWLHGPIWRRLARPTRQGHSRCGQILPCSKKKKKKKFSGRGWPRQRLDVTATVATGALREFIIYLKILKLKKIFRK